MDHDPTRPGQRIAGYDWVRVDPGELDSFLGQAPYASEGAAANLAAR